MVTRMKELGGSLDAVIEAQRIAECRKLQHPEAIVQHVSAGRYGITYRIVNCGTCRDSYMTPVLEKGYYPRR